MSINLGTAVGYLDLNTSKFTRGFASARAAMQGFNDSTQTFSSKTKMVGMAMQSVGGSLTKTITPAVLLLGASIVKTGSKFESAMSQVAATMGKPKKEIKDLENAAIEMGSKTSFSATEAAEALNYLALAGYDSEQQMAALPKVLDLAAAGNMDLASASDMLTDSMSALGLASKDTSKLMANMDSFSNKMAKTATKTNTSVSQLGEAILTVGGMAKNLKGGTTELNAVLGTLADNGIKASESGTHLRNIILAMTPSTKEAKEAFKELGVETYENGKLRSLPDIFLDIRSKMDSMGLSAKEQTKLLSAMFNKTDLASVQALLSTNKDRWDELTDAIDNSSGAAKKMADVQLDNLRGDVTLLKSAIEGLQIRFYNLANNGLRGVIQFITKLIQSINSLSDEQLELIEKIALVAAAIGPVLLIGGKVLTLISGITKAITTISTLTSVFSGLSVGVSAFSSVLLPIAGIIAGIVGAVILFKDAWDENFGGIRDSAKNIFDSVKNIFKDLAAIFKDIVASMRDSWDADLSGIVYKVKSIMASIISMLSLLVSVVSKIVSTIRELWDSNFLGIKEIVTNTLSIIIKLFSGLLSFISDVIKGITQLLSGDFKGALETFKKGFEGLRDTIAKVFVLIIETIKGAISKILSDIKSFFTSMLNTAKTKMAEFASRMADGAKNAKDKFVNFMKELPRNLGTLLGQALGKAVSFVVNFVKEGQKAGKEFGSKLVNGIKNLPSNAYNVLINVINKAKQFVKDFPENAAKAAKSFVDKLKSGMSKAVGVVSNIKDSLVNGIKSLPEKFKDIARNAISGLINGFKEKVSAVTSAIKSFAGGIVSGFKSALDIHSPSRIMEKQVGEQIANGVIKGLDNKVKAGKLKAKEYADALLSAAQKRMENYKVYHDVSLKSEAEYWDKIRKQLKKGTQARIDADKKYFEVKKEYDEKIIQSEIDKQAKLEDERKDKLDYAKKWLENEKVYREVNLTEEVEYWNKVRKQFKNGTDERIESDKKYYEVKKELNQKIKDLDEQFAKDEKEIYDNLSKQVEELNNKYIDAVSERKKTILSAFSLFKEYSKEEEFTSEELTNNLESQVNAIKKYNESINSLSSRGILNDELLKEIKDMGIDATAQINALNEMTDEELQNYADLWKEKMQLATQQAENELAPLKEETLNQISELQEESKIKLEELRDEYASQLIKLGVDNAKVAKKAGINTIKALALGMDETKVQLNNVMKSIENDLLKNLNSLANKAASKVEKITASLNKIKVVANSLNETSVNTIGVLNAVSGSHKAGLDYVPYDGYIARLHKGEAVLTEEENRNRNNVSEGNTFIFNGTPPLDERETARQFKRVQKELALGF